MRADLMASVKIVGKWWKVSKKPLVTPEECFLFFVDMLFNDRAVSQWPKVSNLILRTKMQYRAFGSYDPVEVLSKAREYNEIFEKKREEYNKIAQIRGQGRRHDKRNDFALTFDEWEDCMSYFSNCCAYCGEEKKLTYDHFIPFSKGGSFTKDNIIPACRTCNSSKCDRDFYEWYKKKSFYSEIRLNRVEEYLRLNKVVNTLWQPVNM